MSKHKVKRYDGEDDSMVEPDAMEEANKGENLDTEAGPKAMTMPRRPVSRTPVASAAPSRMSGPGRKPSGPSRADYSNEGRRSKESEPRDRFGIPGKTGNPSAPGPNTIDSSELGRNLSAASNAFGTSGAMQAARRGIAVGKGLTEFAAGRAGAKEAPEVVSAARGALDRAMSAERASPKTGDMAKFNDALKAYKNGPRPVTNPTASQKAWAQGPKGRLGKGAADTLDEYGAAMKRGGLVKKMASGGSISSASSRADGIASKGKTRGTMVMCGGGMAKGKK